jgi:uncharacterized protein DUF2828
MNTLLTGLRKQGNVAYTENNAISNRSTLSDTLDFFYHAAARRGQDNTLLFANAYAEDKLIALKAAFYTRDIRGGQGERNTFSQVLRYLYTHDRNTFEKIVELVPVYGRWKDILEFVDNGVVRFVVKQQLRADRGAEHPSLLAKWMPSQNASSKDTIALANKWINALDMTPREYRKMLTELRKKLVLVETLMSAGKFSEINYAHVPSRAGMLLRKAFSKRDAERYVAYLESVKKGDAKINASTLYPYEIVEKYLRGMSLDETLELQWKALPNYIEANDENAIVVADVSGSMHGTPMAVAISLAIYIAERNSGAFKNYFITFSERPTLQKVKGSTLKQKVENLERANWDMNTNLQAVFNLLLKTALDANSPQSDMPKKLFIVSDMQFDEATGRNSMSNFETIKRKFERAGYTMPVIVFWNVNSRVDETPVVMDEKGVYLVSGASPSIFKAAINARATNPMELMLEVLNSDRYAAIEEALV